MRINIFRVISSFPALLLGFSIFHFGCGWLLGQNARSNEQHGSVPVVLFAMENASGNDEDDHWNVLIINALQSKMKMLKTISLRSQAALDYAEQRLEAAGHAAYALPELLQIGKITDSKRLIFGFYHRTQREWTLRASVINIETGILSTNFSVKATNLNSAISSMCERLLTVLEVPVTDKVLNSIRRGKEVSDSTLEPFSKALHLIDTDGALPNVESLLRKSIASDPEYSDAHRVLAIQLALQGKNSEALTEFETALKINPEDSAARANLSLLLIALGRWKHAEKELLETVRLDPHNARALVTLGDLMSRQGEWDVAIDAWHKAALIDPFFSLAHAALAQGYARTGFREKALKHASEASRLDSNGFPTQLRLINTYEFLHDTKVAVRLYEKLMLESRNQAKNQDFIKELDQRYRALKATLTTHFVSATPPRYYSPKELDFKLRSQLNDAELAFITNPLEGSNEMAKWAVEVTKGATNDLDKAAKIYDTLQQRIYYGKTFDGSARDVFNNWTNPLVSFQCKEYSYLYISLARAVGLKAYFVTVDIDADGAGVSHACAGVFIDGKTILVDITYRWFGAPHREFVFLDDYQNIVNWLRQSDKMERLRLAVNLSPDSSDPKYNLALYIMQQKPGNTSESRQLVKSALTKDDSSFMSHFVRGVEAYYDNKMERSVESLNRAIAIKPKYSEPYYLLGNVHHQLKNTAEARKALERCMELESGVDSALAASARQAMKLVQD